MVYTMLCFPFFNCRPLFNFTSNFVVTVDDTFLTHLQKVSLRMRCLDQYIHLPVYMQALQHPQLDFQPLIPLQQGLVHVEIHQAFGMRYQTLAAGSVRCRELLSSAGGKVHGKAVLTGVWVDGWVHTYIFGR